MSNTYAANFGDVVKHVVLCDMIERERPNRYLESHGGRLDYDLTDLQPGPGGVWDFLDRADDRERLRSSAYASLIGPAAGTPSRPGTYLGSIALADAVLPPHADVVAFELSAESAESLRDGLTKRGRANEVLVADGLDGVCRLGRPGDFVLLDPFDVGARVDSLTAAEAFAALAAHGVRSLLWYAIYTPDEADTWIAEVQSGLDVPIWQARVIGDTSEGGLAGCGFLGVHLSTAAQSAASALVEDLAAVLASSRPGLRVTQ